MAIQEVRRITPDFLYRSREYGYIEWPVPILHPGQPECRKRPTAHNDWQLLFFEGAANLT